MHHSLSEAAMEKGGFFRADICNEQVSAENFPYGIPPRKGSV